MFPDGPGRVERRDEVSSRSTARSRPGVRPPRHAAAAAWRSAAAVSALAGLVIYLLLQLLSGSSGGSTYGSLDGITQAQQTPSQSLGTSCQTGADANERQDCRILGDVNSVQKYWAGWFKAHGKSYTQAKTVFFTGSTSTGCGNATTDVGPFYCPVDKLRLHRPRLLRGAARSLRRQGRPVRRGVRDRARVRPPRAGPAR